MSDPTLAPVQLIAPDALALDADFPPLSMALCQVLLRRRSTRAYSDSALSLYQLSRLLWSAFGINRPQQGLRTAPSAGNQQEIEIYVALPTGLYRFDARQLCLLPVLAADVRAATGAQDYVATAAVDLVYVAKYDGDPYGPRNEQQFYAALDTGCISQNVYLFCAAEGLGTVMRGWLDRGALGALMGLPPNHQVIAAQSVGCLSGAQDDVPELWPSTGAD